MTEKREGTAPRSLVVGAESALRALIAERLEGAGFRVAEAPDGLDGWERMRREPPDLAVVSAQARGLDGVELLRRAGARDELPVLVYTQEPDVRGAVEAIREGALDVLVLPDDLDRLGQHAGRVMENRGGGEGALARSVVGRSAAMQQVRERVLALSVLDVPVLVTGEPGSGREHVARALHRTGPHRSRRFVSLAPDFEPAPRRFDAQSVCFAGDVQRLDPGRQAFLRDLLDPRREVLPTPCRVLASTAEDLHERARRGEFDAGLAEALGRFHIDVPPLRERSEDLGDLAGALAARSARALGRGRASISSAAVAMLRGRSWPGNVRELAAVIERLVAFTPDGRIAVSHVRQVLADASSGVAQLRRERERRQRRELVDLLEQTGGNLAEVARRLDMSRGAIIYRAQKYGLLPGRTPR